MIYNINGDSLSSAYNVSGTGISKAYNSSGTKVFDNGSTSSTIRIANYNVGQWYIGNGYTIPTTYKTDYTNLQTTIFNNIDVDICCMQEATDTFCQDGTLASAFLPTWFDDVNTTTGDVNYQAHKIATNGIGMTDYESINFTNGVSNYLTYEKCYVTLNSKTVCIFNTHLSTNQTYQVAQSGELLTAVAEEEYFILCGDFNTVIEDKTEADYTYCIKPFLDAGYSDANCGDFGIFPTYYADSDPNADYKPATDHIIVSSNITITNAWVETTKLTDDLEHKIDHVPLVAELTIN